MVPKAPPPFFLTQCLEDSIDAFGRHRFMPGLNGLTAAGQVEKYSQPATSVMAICLS